MINPWHDVNIGKEAPEYVMGVIEIPKGSKGKYELDKKTGMLLLDRVLFSAVHYPANYGFIPQTFCEDHDPLDILIISQIDIPSIDDEVERLYQYGIQMKDFVTDTFSLIDESVRSGKKVLYEGAQGILLDIDYGTYPYVTSSSTAPASAPC